MTTCEDFCRRYPHLNPQDVLFRAVELARAAERTFKSELGASFKTHLQHRLKELHRLHDQKERAEGVLIYRTKEDLAHEKAEEEGEPIDPVNFAGGGNGVRLLFDLQWWEALLSDLISRVLHPTTEKRHRLKLGTQLRQSDNAMEAHKRISADLPQVVKQQPPDPELMGWIRAVVDHDIRRQREADAEAEKRLGGDHSPTFLEATRNAVDVKFYKGRKPPRFLPKWMPMARLDDMWSHNQEEDSLHDSIASPDASSTYEKELQAALEVVKAIRPTRTNPSDRCAGRPGGPPGGPGKRRFRSDGQGSRDAEGHGVEGGTQAGREIPVEKRKIISSDRNFRDSACNIGARDRSPSRQLRDLSGPYFFSGDQSKWTWLWFSVACTYRCCAGSILPGGSWRWIPCAT